MFLHHEKMKSENTGGERRQNCHVDPVEARERRSGDVIAAAHQAA